MVGTLKEEIQFKAPLLLFPVKINIVDDSNVTLEPILDMPVTLNKALLFSYANERKLNIDEMNTEFSGNLATQFKNVNDVLKYLKNRKKPDAIIVSVPSLKLYISTSLSS